jgi:hypothetical protein
MRSALERGGPRSRAERTLERGGPRSRAEWAALVGRWGLRGVGRVLHG